MGKTAVQMECGGCFGQSRLPIGDGLGDGCVLGRCGYEPIVHFRGQPSDPHEVHTEGPRCLDEVGVGDGGVDGLIQPGYQGVIRVSGRVSCGEERWSIPKFPMERSKNTGGAPLRSQNSGSALQYFAQLEEFINVVQRDVSHDDTSTAGSLGETLSA